MNKIINLAKQTVIFFLVALFLIWVSLKMGVKTDSSMITLAIYSTIGWTICKVGETIIRKRKKTND